MADTYTIGLDYGTNSVRALIVNVKNGKEVGTHVWNYTHGDAGVVVDPKNPNLARQHPQDYIDGISKSIKGALKKAGETKGFSPDKIIGIGVDTTGSTPLPVDEAGVPLALTKKFGDNPDAMAWLWKDHTSVDEAEEINRLASEMKPEYLSKIGGTYSSEWFWAKILHCLRTAPKVFDAAYTWVEIADWIPAVLTGTDKPSEIKRGICAAGHKAMYHTDWGGYPEKDFLTNLDPKLAELRGTLPDTAYTVRDAAGNLTKQWAKKLELPEGIPVAVGAFDAHLGGIGSGIRPGVLVKNIGTSTCDMMIASKDKKLPDIPGLCGIVPGSITPDDYGLEAGQSAVGDIFNWFVNYIQRGGKKQGTHEELTKLADEIKPGESGLLSLDWNNGNRTILVDQRLTGLILGLTLHSTPAEIYRALIEATAYGARIIMERFEEYDVNVERIIACGGISLKNPMVMQIYADVMGRTIEISRSTQTGALGSAIAGAVVAGKSAGGYDTFDKAIDKMTGTLKKKYDPNRKNRAVYDRIYPLYKRLHDVFGTEEYRDNLYDVMKELLKIRDEARGA
jgi:L-ribulokinase